MSELILHHYPTSPFAEKTRLMLGYKNLPWKSVIIPAVMPKPDVVALTGGYRKTPVLQIGADIYCDTALIADVLEHLQPEPTLYPEPSKGMARTLAHWADTTLFWTAMAYNFQPKGAAQMFGNAPPEAARAFGEDRKTMSAGMTRLRPADAAAAYKSYLRRLSDMLDDWPFLLGEERAVLVGHSLGCMTAVAWAAHSQNTRRVGGALLVSSGLCRRSFSGGTLSLIKYGLIELYCLKN